MITHTQVKPLLVSLAGGLLLLALANSASAQAFSSLGEPPPGYIQVRTNRVSGNGIVVAGALGSYSGYEAFRWTQEGGFVGLGLDVADVQALSYDGGVLVGNTWNEGGYRWSSGSGVVMLDGLPGSTWSQVYGASSDASVVVGYSYGPTGSKGFRWTSEGGTVGLGFLPGETSSVAFGVSDDGTTVIGASGNQAVRWTSEGSIEPLGFSANTWEPWRVSSDASVVAARLTTGEALRWTSEGGATPIGNFTVEAISGDGNVIVGWGNNTLGLYGAVIWDAVNGARNLRDALINDYGLGDELDGWNLNTALGVSDDGKTIVGEGYRVDESGGYLGGWIAVIPEPTTFTLVGLGSL